VRARDWMKKTGVYAFLKEICTSEHIAPDLNGFDSRLIRTNQGRLYLCLLEKSKKQCESQALERLTERQERKGAGMISLDPGERVFFTGYDPSGRIIEWAVDGMNKTLFPVCDRVDYLRSEMAQKEIRHKTRYKLKKLERKARERIKNLVDDCHRKAIQWLCSNYHLILLPSYETSKMVQKEKRCIGKKTARSMYTWCHY